MVLHIRYAAVLLAVLSSLSEQVIASRVDFAREALSLGRVLLQGSDNSADGGAVVGPRRYLTLNSTQIRGVYQGLGQNYPENIWSSFFPPEAFPNCNNNKTVVNYEHHGVTDPPYVTISESSHSDDLGAMVEAHHRSSYSSRILRHENNIMRLQYQEDEDAYCAHWQPYVDELTGEVMIQAADGANNYTDLTCDYVAGNEKPGCFLAGIDIPRYDSSPAIEARAAKVESTGVLANRPAGSVVSVAVASYVCRNGECGTFSPKYARIDAENKD